jgi:hypothetical protein
VRTSGKEGEDRVRKRELEGKGEEVGNVLLHVQVQFVRWEKGDERRGRNKPRNDN